MFWTNFLIYVLLGLFVLDCLFMCLVILMQRSKQEGLGAAFGGGFTDQVWGAQTSQVLVKATVIMAALFFVLSISLARLYSHKAALRDQGIRDAAVQQALSQSAPPVVTNAAPVMPTPTPITTISTNAPAAVAPATPATPDKPAAK